MFYGSGTVDRIASGQLADAGPYAAAGAGCRLYVLTRWKHFAA